MKGFCHLVPIVFALGSWSPPVVCAQEILPEDHPKYMVVAEVFDDLVRAIGDGRTPPALYMEPRSAAGSMKVAWFLPARNSITIQEQVYDLCQSFGPDSLNALAVFLGHELAHYYKDHGWVGDFGNGFADLQVGKRLGELGRDESKMVEIETEADYFGGFFSRVAGYQTLGVAPRALAQVYTLYGLDTDIEGYPSLVERQEIARRSEEKLRRMIPIFEAGNRLLLIAEYEGAARCFEFIGRTFPSREILNNAGVARALEAVDLFDEGVLRYAYPIELDPETRLRGERSGLRGKHRADELAMRGSRKDRRSKLLKLARKSFDQARQKDPEYATAYVNLACVADLQGDFDEAAFLAQKGMKIAHSREEKVSLAHALIARGIARARGEDEQGARRDFEEAGGASLAGINLAVLDGGAVPSRVESAAESAAESAVEKIDGMGTFNYDPIAADPDVIVDLPRLDQERPLVSISAKETGSWRGWLVDMGYRAIAFLETGPDYGGQSGRGVRIGHVFAQVVDVYGLPSSTVAGRAGTYHVYAVSGIVFRTDADERVRSWTIFGIDE